MHGVRKYPPAKPVALRLLAPQRGLFATVRSKSKNKSKSLALLTSLPQHRQIEGEHTPGILKVLLPPRQSRGISLLELVAATLARRLEAISATHRGSNFPPAPSGGGDVPRNPSHHWRRPGAETRYAAKSPGSAGADCGLDCFVAAVDFLLANGEEWFDLPNRSNSDR